MNSQKIAVFISDQIETIIVEWGDGSGGEVVDRASHDQPAGGVFVAAGFQVSQANASDFNSRCDTQKIQDEFQEISSGKFLFFALISFRLHRFSHYSTLSWKG